MNTPSTIPEALFATAERPGSEHVFHLGDRQARLSVADLAERAERGARRLLALGVEPGDAVGVLGPNRPEWMVWAFATWIAGAVLVPVQIPLRVRDPEAFGERLRALVRAGGCRCVLAEPRLLPLLPDGVAIEWEEGGPESGEDPAPPAAQDPAVIQFTSGSTAAPKGALLTHVAVSAQMDVLKAGYCYSDGSPRTTLSWTPFFHDLGLFGNVVQPAYRSYACHHLPTERFAKDPAEWLRLVAATGVQVTVGPSSAFGSALRAATRKGERVDLRALEAACFAAEGVDPAVSQRMLGAAEDFGLRPEAVGSTYGLAEAVMAVSFRYVGTGLRTDRVSLPALAADGVAVPARPGNPARTLISAGTPQMALRIAASDGEALPERHVGEIQVRGASTMSRYVGKGAPDPFRDGWLCTGDLGYVADGDLYVSGRAKDVMIATGHNYYPEDFEWAAARVDGVRPGRCVAFGVPGAEKVVVLVEAGSGAAADLGRQVERAIADAVGVAPGEVVVLPPDTLEKTTSGKLRRRAMRDAYAAGALSGAAL